MNLEIWQKYSVNHQEALTIRCQACGRLATFPVASLKGRKHSLQVCCPCSEIFAVDLEFRHDFRVKIDGPATFRALSTPKSRARDCAVANQSKGGLLLLINEEVPIKTDDRLIVCYRPQVKVAGEIERIITVRHYERGASIGGAFIDAPFPPPLRVNTIVLH